MNLKNISVLKRCAARLAAALVCTALLGGGALADNYVYSITDYNGGPLSVSVMERNGSYYYNIVSAEDGAPVNQRSWDAATLFFPNGDVLAGLDEGGGMFTWFRVSQNGSETLLGSAPSIDLIDDEGYFYISREMGKTVLVGSWDGGGEPYSQMTLLGYGLLAPDFSVVFEPKWDEPLNFDNGYSVAKSGSEKFEYVRGIGYVGDGKYSCISKDGGILLSGCDSMTDNGGGKLTVSYGGTTSRVDVIKKTSTDDSYDSWAKADVTAAAEAGIVPLDLQRSYTAAITRSEYCRLVMEMLDVLSCADSADVGTAVSFSDCDDEYVLKAASLGLVEGVGGGRFEPDRGILRQEAAVLLYRLAGHLGIEPGDGEAPVYLDGAEVPDWAVEAVLAVGRIIGADGTALMQGTGGDNFTPGGSYSRQESIITMYRLYNMSGGVEICSYPLAEDFR